MKSDSTQRLPADGSRGNRTVRFSPGNVNDSIEKAQQDFTSTLQAAIQDVLALELETGKTISEVAPGNRANADDLMIAVQKARASFDRLVGVHGRILDIYRAILRRES